MELRFLQEMNTVVGKFTPAQTREIRRIGNKLKVLEQEVF
jgi:hypothetical protein